MKFKIMKKNVITGVVLAAVLAVVFYARAQYVVPVIMYHKIDGNSAVSRLSVSPKSFKAQMNFLKKHKYNVVKFEDLAEMLKEKKLPSKTIAITFDDGYEDNYLNAYPILKETGLTATIFVIPAMVGKEGYLTWGQIAEMSESGLVTIGSHTLTHSCLPGMAVQQLGREIAGSKSSIEGHLGKKVNTFSYPLGGFDKAAREEVIKAEYKIAAATNPGKKYPKHDLFAMKRLRISNSSDNLFVFWFEITGFYTWIKEHRDKD
jgi:peptidoglycan/xylan/chitin deacetylase (PgdA/CDA1 family)